MGFLANTLIVTAPLLLAQNPVSVITETVNDAKRVRTGRGKLFLILSAFFFVEGLGILAQPNLAQRVCVSALAHHLASLRQCLHVSADGQQPVFRLVCLLGYGGCLSSKDVEVCRLQETPEQGIWCRRLPGVFCLKPWVPSQGVEHDDACANRQTGLLQALSGPAIKMDDPLIGLLFSLVAASAHIIVPAAVFNLKVHLPCPGLSSCSVRRDESNCDA